MADWNQFEVIKSFHSPVIQMQLKMLAKQSEFDLLKLNESDDSFLTQISTEQNSKKKRKKEPIREKFIGVNELKRRDLQEIIDVERENSHSNLVAIMIFDRNNTPKRTGSIYSYYKPKPKKSWFYYAFGLKSLGDSFVSLQPGLTDNRIDLKETDSNRKSSKQIKFVGIGTKTTLEEVLQGITSPSTGNQSAYRNKDMISLNRTMDEGLIAPPTSTSPVRKGELSIMNRKKNHNFQSVKDEISEIADSSFSTISVSNSMSHLKMGKTLNAVLNGEETEQGNYLRKSLKSSMNRKKDVKERERHAKRRKAREESDLISANAGITPESFHIPFKIETLDTSFELAIQSPVSQPSAIKQSPKLKKKAKVIATQKPFLGIESLFK